MSLLPTLNDFDAGAEPLPSPHPSVCTSTDKEIISLHTIKFRQLMHFKHRKQKQRKVLLIFTLIYTRGNKKSLKSDANFVYLTS